MTYATQKFKQHEQVVATELDASEAVLLHLQEQRYFTLNETGWLIWQAIGEGLDTESITKKLQAEYEVDDLKAKQSVLAMIDELESQKLIKAA